MKFNLHIYKWLLISCILCFFISCSESSSTEGVIQKIHYYRLLDSKAISDGDCSGTSGIAYDGENFEVRVDAKAEDGFEFSVTSEVRNGGSVRAKFDGEIFEGDQYLFEKEGVNYTIDILISIKLRAVYHVIKYDDKTLVLRMGKKI